MIAPEIQQDISYRLHQLESETGVQVLYACESGSRAWGFASADSDYDVRFVFAHPSDKYVSIFEPTDYLERSFPGDLDVSGWDIRKALRQLHKGNASMTEWFFSDYVYLEQQDFADRMRALLRQYFQPKPCLHHYVSLGNNFLGRCNDVSQPPTAKALFYLLRPVLAASWAATRNEPPPVAFATLMQLLDVPELTIEVNRLMVQKAEGREKDTVQPSQLLLDWATAQLTKLKQQADASPVQRMDAEPLDSLFQQYCLPK